jgi:hypothetical protein
MISLAENKLNSFSVPEQAVQEHKLRKPTTEFIP